MPAICDLLLGFLLYKSRLVPRGLSLIGIVGAFPLVISWLATLFGTFGPQTAPSPFGAILVALRVLAGYLADRQGLRPEGRCGAGVQRIGAYRQMSIGSGAGADPAGAGLHRLPERRRERAHRPCGRRGRLRRPGLLRGPGGPAELYS